MMYVRCKTVPALVEKGCSVKVLRGRDRKHHDRIEYLHQIPLFEFESPSSRAVQLSRSLIQYIALTLLEELNYALNSFDVDPTTGQ